MSHAMFRRDQEEKIAEWLKQVKFRKRLFGGVRESDVWKKISELNDMYREALFAEKVRYETLLSEKGKPGKGQQP